MILKRFNIKVIIRVILLAGNVMLFSRILGDQNLFFNQLILALLFVFQLVELIYFINHTNRELARLFLAIKHADFSLSFRENEMGSSFRELHKSLAEIQDAYKEVKIEKEIQYQFLQKLINQINIGIITLENERIGLINPTAERILGVDRIKNWGLVRQTNPALVNELDSIGEQGRKLVEVNIDGELKIIAVDISTITLMDTPRRIITMQDINSEIEQKEIEAWHKLIRILTHEIMNSVTPITSLTETMQGMLSSKTGEQKKLNALTEETISDIRFSLDTIHKRSEGILNFVENYRKMARVPKPKIEAVPAKEYLEYIVRLLSTEIANKEIGVSIRVNPENLQFYFDKALMEQALINLITNSIHALQNATDKQLILAAYTEDTRIILEITDTGTGIDGKAMNEIFVPFFSTKKDGSGIGLSLTKQIVSVHGGSIKVTSTPGYGTSFYLRFRKPDKPSR
jgi:two-component system, NtrC family, nitrogen regulation sensor histidine kinase NtrY